MAGTKARAYIKATFNNTILTFTDPEGKTICWGSAGTAGFKGARKSTPYAATVTVEAAAKKAIAQGVREVEVYIKGPGPGRESGRSTPSHPACAVGPAPGRFLRRANPGRSRPAGAIHGFGTRSRAPHWSRGRRNRATDDRRQCTKTRGRAAPWRGSGQRPQRRSVRPPH